MYIPYLDIQKFQYIQCCLWYDTSIVFPEYFVEGMHVEVWNALGLQNELSLSF